MKPHEPTTARQPTAGHRCATCGATDPTHRDDGPPTGWWLVAQMTKPGCWDDDKDWQFCSHYCLVGWAVDD